MAKDDSMKVYPRTSEILGAVSLFDALAAMHGLDLTKPEDVARFGAVAVKAMESVRAQPNVLHGWRTQSMFAYVAASLGNAEVVKEEDAGRLIAREENLQVPDYRLLLRDGSEILVEVKNCHKPSPSARFSLRTSDLNGLRRYSDRFGKPLRLAIYWSSWNAWTLVAADALTVSNERAGITFAEAMVANEMSILGDRFIGTRAPLVLSLVADPEKPRVIQPDGKVPFTIGAVEMYSAGERIRDAREKTIAFYLMFYGRWSMEQSPQTDGSLLRSLDFVFSPVEDSGQGFEIVGTMSGMISQQYNQLTTTMSRSIRRLTPNISPSRLGLVLKEPYQGQDLPLWRLVVEAA